MTYAIPHAVYSVHYITDQGRGFMRFSAPDPEALLAHFAKKFPTYRVELIERFSLRA